MLFRSQVAIRVADAWPFDIQDLLPSDSKFKIILFAGDVKDNVQKARLNDLAIELGKPSRFLNHPSKEALFDFISICIGKKEEVDYTDVPAFFRPHWSK